MLASFARRLLAAFVLIVVGSVLSRGQSAPSARLAATRQLLVSGTLSARLVPAAGIIFSGHVTSVTRNPSAAGLTGASTVVTFQVDEGIRGTSTGQKLTIREWAGLWDQGERYRIGEGVFLFLYPPSSLGLTSPVGGGSGRFAVDPQRRVVINAQNAATLGSGAEISGKILIPYAAFRRVVLRNAVGK